MKAIPVLKCRNMQRSLSFYTRVLDFKLKHAEAPVTSPVVDLMNGEAEIQLSILEGDSVYGSAVNILVDDVDRLFTIYIRRGLDTSSKLESPVHQGPVDQTWGMREFYVCDPDGNTLRFRQSIG